MKREILFKAKRLDNNELVEGDIIEDEDKTFKLHSEVYFDDGDLTYRCKAQMLSLASIHYAASRGIVVRNIHDLK